MALLSLTKVQNQGENNFFIFLFNVFYSPLVRSTKNLMLELHTSEAELSER